MALTDTTAEGPTPKAPGFGLATATFVVVSSMIGTGVLTTSGFTVFFVGSNQLMLALWVIGGLVALCGALTVAELSASLPRSGGDYVYLYEAYGPLAAFLSGWVSFLIGFGGPIALSAFAAAKYLLVPLHLDESTRRIAQKGVATLAILAFALVHSSGRTGTVRVQGGATLLKLGILGLLAVAGLAAGWGHWDHFADRPPLADLPPFLAIVSSFVYISYGYTGWNAATYLAGEIEEPQASAPPGHPAGHGPGPGALPGPEYRLRSGPLGRGRRARSSTTRPIPTSSSPTPSRRSPSWRPSDSSAAGCRTPSRSRSA